jgi:CSLREA domain-containing protein
MLRKIKFAALVLFLTMVFGAAQEARADLGGAELATMETLRTTHGWGPVFSWTASNPCPSSIGINWGGVACDNIGGQTAVTSLILGCGIRLLDQEPPPILTSLAHLREFTIRGCALRGSLAFRPGAQPQLKTIRLDINRLNGTLNDFFPDGISPAQFPSLTSNALINLANNEISGPIPAGLMEFNTGLTLILTQNRLSGILPPTRNTTGSLPRFDFSGNALEGVLPSYMSCAGAPTCKIDYNKFDVVNTPPGMTNFGWRATQTVPPQNVQVQATGAGTATLTWTPIEYQAHGGYYEVLSSQTPGGPYTSLGTTANSGGKTAASLTVSGLPGGTNYFVVRTYTPAHSSNKNNLTSINSAEVAANVAPPLTVTKTDDTNDGACNEDCSLREAVAAAQSGDTIVFASPLFDTPQVINLNRQIVINRSMTIKGTSADRLVIRSTAAAASNSRVFVINSVTATITDMTITGGNVTARGGGIANSGGTLTLQSVHVTANTASEGGGGIVSDGGTLNVINSTISNNTDNTSGTGGGGISTHSSTLNITNSTISGNRVPNSTLNGNGGGISALSGTTTIINSTITNNSIVAGTISASGVFSAFGTILVRNSIIAANQNNATTPDVADSGSGAFDAASANNIIGNVGTVSSFTAANQNQTGNSITQADPRLLPLGNYGGATQTHALLSNSPAINAANNCVTNLSCASANPPVALTTDQRGASRVGQADIGAFELNNSFVANLPEGRQGELYNFSLVPNRGSFTYSTTPSDLPDGINLVINQATGEVSLNGIPTENGIFTFSVTTSDGTNSAAANYALEILPPLDSTPPVITPNISGTQGNNGWYTSDVQVSWSVVDAESTVSSQTGCATQSVTTDTDGITFTCEATSAGGTASQSVTIKRDAAAPSINFASRTPAANANGWNNTNVTVNWSCADARSGAVSPGVSQTLSGEGNNLSATGICADNAGNTAQDTQSGIKIDKTAPGISFVSRTAANSNGWNNTNVSVNWSCADALSGVIGSSVSQTLTGEGANQSASGTCFDLAGNSAQDTRGGINIDKTAPTLNPSVAPNPVLLNGTATATANASDSLSGIASASCGAPDTASVGFKSVSCAATDLAGNTATASANYQVIYNFAGFFQPIANLPVVNEVNAGQSVPIKFSLSGYQGLNIFAAGYPISSPVACAAGEPGSTIDQTVSAGSSSLSYDAATDRYTYVWKTNKAWKGTCRMLVVRFIDGSEYYAKFRFK